ncbi:hypothetical protein DH2020_021205 [Rehmannia glutinosa]|uniref:Uncharacterized protein n=1 Tax=Rehmannia glutinosa TaxID=99300 RepID=A0ABR0WDZ4_REHGL
MPPPSTRPPVASACQPAPTQQQITPPAVQTVHQLPRPHSVRPPTITTQNLAAPPVQAVQHAAALFSGTSSRPPLISAITPVRNSRVGGEIRAPAPHLQSFRPAVASSPAVSQLRPLQRLPSQPIQTPLPPGPPPVALTNLVVPAPPNPSLPTVGSVPENRISTALPEICSTFHSLELADLEVLGNVEGNQTSTAASSDVVCLSDDEELWRLLRLINFYKKESSLTGHPVHGERVHQFVIVPVRVGGIEYSAKEDQTKEKDAEEEKKKGFVKEEKHGEISRDRKEEETQERKEGPSLEEISKLRGTAQHNTMEAIRAVEERYEKAKKTGPSAEQKGGALKDTAMEKGQQAKDCTEEKALEAKDVTASKGVALKDTAMEKGQQSKDYTEEKAMEAKDGKLSHNTLLKKSKAAKDTTVDTSMVATEYVGEKAVAAKDVTVESGKGAAGYAGKVASGVTV